MSNIGKVEDQIVTVGDLTRRYVQEYEQFQHRRKLLEQRRDKLQKQLDKLQMPLWIDLVVKPIAKELERQLPGYNSAILGPLGVGARVSIHLYKIGVPEKSKFDGDNCKSITFEPAWGQDTIRVVDYSINTGEYSSGTIGEMNGFNHPTLAIPEGEGVDWLMQYVR